MIFITGPLWSGKRDAAKRLLGCGDAELAARAVWDVQELALGADLSALADRLAQKDIVIAAELGAGLVPIDRTEREKREAAGRLACLLAERADTVVRVCCGLGQVLKGKLP